MTPDLLAENTRTTLRFVGPLPLWAGALLAVAVAASAWRFYAREAAGLRRWVRFALPALRSAAFALGVLLLTQPVLHHRTTVGELGAVRVFVDGSESMALADAHLPLARKVRIAESLGWLPPGAVAFGPLAAADDLRTARDTFAAAVAEDGAAGPYPAARAFADSLAPLGDRLGEPHATRLRTELREPLDRFIDGADGGDAASLIAAADRVGDAVRADVDADLAARVAAGGPLANAVNLTDDAPRRHRAARALTVARPDAPGGVLAALRERHDVTVRALIGGAAVPFDPDARRGSRAGRGRDGPRHRPARRPPRRPPGGGGAAVGRPAQRRAVAGRGRPHAGRRGHAGVRGRVRGGRGGGGPVGGVRRGAGPRLQEGPRAGDLHVPRHHCRRARRWSRRSGPATPCCGGRT